MLCVVRDVVDPVQDQKLAEFVVGSHAASHPSLVPTDGPLPVGAASAAAAGSGAAADPDILPQETLRKYLTYAKQHCRPSMQAGEHANLTAVYAELRRQAFRSHGMPIAVRHLESMIRMSEAHARMHLRTSVTPGDVEAAIRVMVDSFVATQKHVLQRELRRQMGRFVVLPGDYNAVLLHVLRDLLRFERNNQRLLGEAADGAVSVSVRSLEERARELQIADLHGFYASAAFSGAGFRLDRDAGVVVYDG